MTSSLFKDLSVTDLYVRLDGTSPAIYQSQKKGKHRINAVVPPIYDEEIRNLGEVVRSNGLKEDTILQVGPVRMRMSRQTMADGEDWICLRVIKTDVPKLHGLGIQPVYANALHELGRRDGLTLITGATGHGKTTTSVAMLQDFLITHGGIAVTIEDPVEYVMKGKHGEKGFCFQVEVDDEGWDEAIKRALRWAPQFIFVGEIRTPKAAEQLLRAATTGHSVITTMHAGSSEEALMGLMHMAEQAMGGSCSMILAAGLSAVVHQTMTETGPTLRMVTTEPHNMGDPVRALIRDNKVGMITTYIDKMSARLIHNAPDGGKAGSTATTAHVARHGGGGNGGNGGHGSKKH
jgi:twitching motility protein PilT